MLMLPAWTTSGSKARLPMIVPVDMGPSPSLVATESCAGVAYLLAAFAFEVVHGIDGHFVSIHLLELSCGITHRDHFLSTNYFFCLLASGIDSDWSGGVNRLSGEISPPGRARESGHGGMEGTTMTGQNGQKHEGLYCAAQRHDQRAASVPAAWCSLFAAPPRHCYLSGRPAGSRVPLLG